MFNEKQLFSRIWIHPNENSDRASIPLSQQVVKCTGNWSRSLVCIGAILKQRWWIFPAGRSPGLFWTGCSTRCSTSAGGSSGMVLYPHRYRPSNNMYLKRQSTRRCFLISYTFSGIMPFITGFLLVLIYFVKPGNKLLYLYTVNTRKYSLIGRCSSCSGVKV